MHLSYFQHLVCFLFNQDFMINFVFVLEDLIQGFNLDWPLQPVPTTDDTIAASHMTLALKNVVYRLQHDTTVGKASMPYHFPCFSGSVASPCIKAGVSSKTQVPFVLMAMPAGTWTHWRSQLAFMCSALSFYCVSIIILLSHPQIFLY